MMGEVHKIVFMGAPGSGKTTCIRALSEIDPVSTDVPCTDELRDLKETTTVALDYGELQLDGESRVLLYGLPGQERFSYMFEVVRAGLLGAIVLVDATSREAVEELSRTLACHRADLRKMPFIVALNKSEQAADAIAERCRETVREHGLMAPVMTVDARRREDIAHLIELLLVILEFGFGFEPNGEIGRAEGLA